VTGAPLAWATAAGLAVILATAPMIGDALGDLAVARAERVRLRAVISQPPASHAVVDPGQAMAAADRDAANGMLALRLRRLAGRGAVLVEEAVPVADPAGLARVRVRLSGSNDAVIALVDTVERGPPLARFAQWRIDANDGAVRLQGEVVAPWR